MSAALALVPASPDLSPARAALTSALADRQSLDKSARTIAQARQRLSSAAAAETEAKGALSALATFDSEAFTMWAIDGKGSEPKPDLGKRRSLEAELDDARVRADAARTALARLDAASGEDSRRIRAADEAVSLALSAVLIEELSAEAESVRRVFTDARAKVRSLVKLAGSIENICAAQHKGRAASLAYEAQTMMAPSPDQFVDLGDWTPMQRAVAQLISDLRAEPSATLSVE